MEVEYNIAARISYMFLVPLHFDSSNNPINILCMFFFNISGLERKLKDPDDLFDLPADMSCNTISCKMDKALIGNVDKYQAPSDIQDTPRSSGKSNNYSDLLIIQKSTLIIDAFFLLQKVPTYLYLFFTLGCR